MRQQDLRREGIISAAALGNAENATLSSRASVDTRAAVVARAQASIPTAALAVERAALTLERAERELGNTNVSAPFGGVVQDVSFALGRQVSPNDVLARLVDLQQLELKFQLSDEQLGALIVFAGHRYEPLSHPALCGPDTQRCFAYCTTAQAIADWAALLEQKLPAVELQVQVGEGKVATFGHAAGGAPCRERE